MAYRRYTLEYMASLAGRTKDEVEEAVAKGYLSIDITKTTEALIVANMQAQDYVNKRGELDLLTPAERPQQVGTFQFALHNIKVHRLYNSGLMKPYRYICYKPDGTHVVFPVVTKDEGKRKAIAYCNSHLEFIGDRAARSSIPGGTLYLTNYEARFILSLLPNSPMAASLRRKITKLLQMVTKRGKR